MTTSMEDFADKLKGVLSKRNDRKNLIKFLSHISEESYRRGVQHALQIPEKIRLPRFDNPDRVSEWRNADIGKSRGICGYNMTSKERFLIQFPEWEELDD